MSPREKATCLKALGPNGPVAVGADILPACGCNRRIQPANHDKTKGHVSSCEKATCQDMPSPNGPVGVCADTWPPADATDASNRQTTTRRHNRVSSCEKATCLKVPSPKDPAGVCADTCPACGCDRRMKHTTRQQLRPVLKGLDQEQLRQKTLPHRPLQKKLPCGTAELPHAGEPRQQTSRQANTLCQRHCYCDRMRIIAVQAQHSQHAARCVHEWSLTVCQCPCGLVQARALSQSKLLQ